MNVKNVSVLAEIRYPHSYIGLIFQHFLIKPDQVIKIACLDCEQPLFS